MRAIVLHQPAPLRDIAAPRSLAKGGIVAIHLDRIPQFDYDSLLWGERQLRSVANMTRQDGRDFLQLAEQIKLTPATQTFPLAQANEAMQSIRRHHNHPRCAAALTLKSAVALTDAHAFLP